MHDTNGKKDNISIPVKMNEKSAHHQSCLQVPMQRLLLNPVSEAAWPVWGRLPIKHAAGSLIACAACPLEAHQWQQHPLICTSMMQCRTIAINFIPGTGQPAGQNGNRHAWQKCQSVGVHVKWALTWWQQHSAAALHPEWSLAVTHHRSSRAQPAPALGRALQFHG